MFFKKRQHGWWWDAGVTVFIVGWPLAMIYVTGIKGLFLNSHWIVPLMFLSWLPADISLHCMILGRQWFPIVSSLALVELMHHALDTGYFRFFKNFSIGYGNNLVHIEDSVETAQVEPLEESLVVTKAEVLEQLLHGPVIIGNWRGMPSWWNIIYLTQQISIFKNNLLLFEYLVYTAKNTDQNLATNMCTFVNMICYMIKLSKFILSISCVYLYVQKELFFVIVFISRLLNNHCHEKQW